jgi:hypothetical protein
MTQQQNIRREDRSLHIKELVEKKHLKVLRERRTNKALNVSYTEDGLKFTMNKTGRYIFDPEKNYVEEFNPREFKDPHLQKCEVIWIMKATKL